MKKHLYLLFLSSFFAVAQIPAGYYNNATGTGFTLKTQLKTIINPHTQLVYGSGLWSLFQTSDLRPNGYVWDIYSNCNFVFGAVVNGGQQDDGTQGNAECQRYNKEHTFPKSWFGGQIYPMYSDAFIVMPADKKDNAMRGSIVYATVSPSVTTTYGNGFKIGNCATPNYPYTSQGLQVLEPSDEFKGDFARNYFYVATCYEDAIASWQTLDPNGNTILDGSSDKVFEQWYLDMLFSWHLADPVSQKEIDRNNAIYAVQGNRNPFIDHPEYAQLIWGSLLKKEVFDNAFSSLSVFPNPSNNHSVSISCTLLLDNIQLYAINGQLLQELEHPLLNNNTYTINDIPKGFYFLKINANNQSVIKKIIIE
ncbi:endonuclease [Flavobacterium aciduliphilum]|uniref:Putative secreted protein (Por secretion system target) n=1 Tax=Flavobacterium aciduliphilum TaxID=1101402 RepID=A0A328YA92_9FLAO|nr:endonuclease [Flavobacterium aciduliphilum]RAR70083.1 putative secreted protein (Por secretion system target) [Flavobacterium aciduliphilum]